jgi:hypothetical protein
VRDAIAVPILARQTAMLHDETGGSLSKTKSSMKKKKMSHFADKSGAARGECVAVCAQVSHVSCVGASSSSASAPGAGAAVSIPVVTTPVVTTPVVTADASKGATPATQTTQTTGASGASGASDVVSVGVDYTLVPAQLDALMSELDDEGSVRATTITPGSYRHAHTPCRLDC